MFKASLEETVWERPNHELNDSSLMSRPLSRLFQSVPHLIELPKSTQTVEFLAWDEALLDAAEVGRANESLWFWESPSSFVVLGCGQKAAIECHLDACDDAKVPVLRRCTGGGTVLQGHGCLNYALLLRCTDSGPLASITGTNAWIMGRQCRALTTATGRNVRIEGHTDLAIDGLKISGNAQRRRRHWLLFHGTLLHHFPLEKIGTYLKFPSAQPNYRQQRDHVAFVCNMGLDSAVLKQALCEEWAVTQSDSPLPTTEFQSAMVRRYSRPEWHRGL